MDINYGNMVDVVNAASLLLILLGVFIAYIGRRLHLWKRLTRRRNKTYQSPYDSAILSYFTVGHGLTNAKRGKINDMRYALYITLPVGPNQGSDFTYTKDGALLYTLDLPFSTNVHMVGISTDYDIDRVQFEAYLKANGMEQYS